jgi:hypothetical protein
MFSTCGPTDLLTACDDLAKGKDEGGRCVKKRKNIPWVTMKQSSELEEQATESFTTTLDR